MHHYQILDTRKIAQQFLKALENQDREVAIGSEATLCLDGRGYLLRRGRFSMGVNFSTGQDKAVKYLQFNRGGASHECAE